MADSRFNPQAFQAWRQAKVTQPFLQYLRDTSEALARQWSQGVEMSPAHQVQAKLFLELADLQWDDVRAFYGIEETDADT